MKDNNCIHIIGRIGTDLKLETSKNDVKFTKFNVAVNRDKDNTDWFSCVAFNNTANNICNWFEKGRLISLTGSMVSDTREVEGKEGPMKVKYWTFNIDTFSFLDSGKKDQAQPTEQSKPQYREEKGGLDLSPDALPFY